MAVIGILCIVLFLQTTTIIQMENNQTEPTCNITSENFNAINVPKDSITPNTIRNSDGIDVEINETTVSIRGSFVVVCESEKVGEQNE